MICMHIYIYICIVWGCGNLVLPYSYLNDLSLVEWLGIDWSLMCPNILVKSTFVVPTLVVEIFSIGHCWRLSLGITWLKIRRLIWLVMDQSLSPVWLKSHQFSSSSIPTNKCPIPISPSFQGYFTVLLQYHLWILWVIYHDSIIAPGPTLPLPPGVRGPQRRCGGDCALGGRAAIAAAGAGWGHLHHGDAGATHRPRWRMESECFFFGLNGCALFWEYTCRCFWKFVCRV